MAWLPWILLPGVGAVIGFATNWVAIRMLFHPRRKRWGVQGLLPRRQRELAHSVGRIVGEDLLALEELLAPLHDVDLEPHLVPVIDAVIAAKVDEFRSIPLIGAMLTPERLGGLRDLVVRELVARQDEILTGITAIAEEHIDVAAMVEERVAAFDLDQLEDLVHRVAKTEFRAIQWWGALLGALIGVVQATLLAVLPG